MKIEKIILPAAAAGTGDSVCADQCAAARRGDPVDCHHHRTRSDFALAAWPVDRKGCLSGP